MGATGVGDEGCEKFTNGEGDSAGSRRSVRDSDVDAQQRGRVGGSGRGVITMGVFVNAL